MDTVEFIYETIADIMEIPRVDLCSGTDFVMELGTTEMDMMDIIVDLEEEFDIEIEEREISDINTIQDLINLTLGKM